jgi:hypothetical protein
VVSLTATTDADHKGAQAAFPPVGDIVLHDTNRTIYEALVNLRKCSTFFVGLFETGEAVFGTTSAIPDKGYVGFRRVNGGDVLFVVHKTGVTEQTVSVIPAADLSTPTGSNAAADEPYKLGFAVNGHRTIDICVNGVIKAAEQATLAVSSATLPATVLTRVVAALRGATADESAVRLDIDWQASYAENA